MITMMKRNLLTTTSFFSNVLKHKSRYSKAVFIEEVETVVKRSIKRAKINKLSDPQTFPPAMLFAKEDSCWPWEVLSPFMVAGIQ